MTAPSKLKLSMDGPVAVIALNDPSSLNAASVDLAQALTVVLRGLGQPGAAFGAEARALVLTGEGRAFCSGANLSTGAASSTFGTQGKPDPGPSLDHTYNPLMETLRALPIPIVTAVNGAAAGIGCSIALMGDLIVAGESGYFLQAFRRIGLVPDGGSTWLLSRMVGKARAAELTLLGEKLPAKTALEWGLINRCVADDQLMSSAIALARNLADGPASLALIRKLMWDGMEAGLSDQLHAESLAQTQAAASQDFVEGVSAFFQKRPAKFTGR
jgi:2-(1,2-epoxy-1,2-dihydrophenyl)acetyl-CoA isomerase